MWKQRSTSKWKTSQQFENHYNIKRQRKLLAIQAANTMSLRKSQKPKREMDDDEKATNRSESTGGLHTGLRSAGSGEDRPKQPRGTVFSAFREQTPQSGAPPGLGEACGAGARLNGRCSVGRRRAVPVLRPVLHPAVPLTGSLRRPVPEGSCDRCDSGHYNTSTSDRVPGGQSR